MKDKTIANGLLRFARNDDANFGKGSGFLRLRRKKPDHLPKMIVIAKEERVK